MKVKRMRMELTSLIVCVHNSQSRHLYPFMSTLGSPKYFGPILHYLRTNSIDIPAGYKLSSIRMEAEFYGIQKIIDHIDFLESEKKDEIIKGMAGEKGRYMAERKQRGCGKGNFYCIIKFFFAKLWAR